MDELGRRFLELLGRLHRLSMFRLALLGCSPGYRIFGLRLIGIRYGWLPR